MKSIVASNRSGAIPLPSINSRLIADCHPDPEIKSIDLAISEIDLKVFEFVALQGLEGRTIRGEAINSSILLVA